jgi:hypothetical protein
MEIHKNTWHYNLWRFTYLLGDVPERRSPYCYAWRLFLVPFLIPLVIMFLLVIGLCALALFLGANAFMILSGAGYMRPIDTFTPFPPFKLWNRRVPITWIAGLAYGIAALTYLWK